MKIKKPREEVISGHHVEGRPTAGPPLFTQLNFKIFPGLSGLVAWDPAAQSLFCRVLSGQTNPSQGVINRSAFKCLLFSSSDEITSERTIADELGRGHDVRALRLVQSGATDEDALSTFAEAWDTEERLSKALSEFGFRNIDLLQPFLELDPDQRLFVRLARIAMLKQTNSLHSTILVWDDPTKDLNLESRSRLIEFVQHFNGTLVLCSQDVEILEHVDRILKLSPAGLQEYPGNYQPYLEQLKSERAEAHDKMEKAKLELEHQLHLADEAHEKRRTRRERAQQFADTGIPKVHRGNMKRRSQESMAKAGAKDLRKIQSAEEHLREALERLEQIESSPLVEDSQITAEEHQSDPSGSPNADS